MSIFLSDPFIDTEGVDLSNHISGSGVTYIKHPLFTDAMTIQSNRVGKDTNTATTVYYASVIPPHLEYDVEGVIVDIGEVNRAFGIAGWVDTSVDSGIVLRRQNITTVQLLTIVNGTPSATLASTTVVFSAGVSRHLKLRRLPGDLFEVSLDGVVFGSNISITDSAFQVPGRIGLRASNNHTGTGYHIESLVANSRHGAHVGSGLRPRIFAPGIVR